MISKFCKNLILCGEIDYYCLLCKEAFENPCDVEKHIRWENHRKLIKTLEYLPKFKNDGVHKLEDKYFCEICNFIAPRFNVMKSHIKEESHKAKKANPEDVRKESLVERKQDFVVVSKTTLTKKEWNGIINNQCLFCNTAVPFYGKHVITLDHIMKLVQSETIVEDDRVYRKINDNTSYCITCRKTFNNEYQANHWTSEEHLKRASGIGKPSTLFDVDYEKWTVTCILCNETLIRSTLRMHDHREKHVKRGEWIKELDDHLNEKDPALAELYVSDKGKLRADLKRYGAPNFIKLNEGGSKGYCTLCNTHISAHMINFRQHVNGARHNSFLELKGLVKATKKTEKPRYKTVPFLQFLKEVVHVKSSRTFLVLSAEVCIDILSFTLMNPLSDKGDKIACFVCEDIFTDIPAHLNTDHKYKLFNANVVTTIEGEFIRELTPGLYHCGVCNASFAGWSVLKKHLTLLKHKFARLEAHKMVEDVVDPSIFELEGNCVEPHHFSSFQADDFVLD